MFSNYILSKKEPGGYVNMGIINNIQKMVYTGGNTQACQYIPLLKETIGATVLCYVEQLRQPIRT